MTILNAANLPVLTTERLTLRPLAIDDRQEIFLLRSDPAINKFLDREPSRSPEDAVAFISKVKENVEAGNTCYWAITLVNTKPIIGTICLFNFSDQNNSCEIGYELMTACQGKGIMKEAVRAVVDYVFQILPFKTILAGTHSGNHRSAQLLQNLNFVRSGEADKENPNLIVFLLRK